jgi:hypothetical protein
MWFAKKMDEDKNNKHFNNYPVEVRAMKIRWFILSTYGREFLKSILNNENLELYNIPTLRIMIEYFYRQYKNFLFKQDLPLFLIKNIIFLITLFLNETHNQNHIKKRTTNDGLYHFLIVVLLLFQILVQTIQLYMSYKQY